MADTTIVDIKQSEIAVKDVENDPEIVDVFQTRSSMPVTFKVSEDCLDSSDRN